MHTSLRGLVAYVAPTLRLSFQTVAGYDTFKIKSISKKRVRLRSEVWKTTATKWNRTQIQGSPQSNASVVECQQESMIVLWIKNHIDLI